MLAGKQIDFKMQSEPTKDFDARWTLNRPPFTQSRLRGKLRETWGNRKQQIWSFLLRYCSSSTSIENEWMRESGFGEFWTISDGAFSEEFS
jgi:hypothetical protein